MNRLFFYVIIGLSYSNLFAKFYPSQDPLSLGFLPIPFVSTHNLEYYKYQNEEEKKRDLSLFCKKLAEEFKRYDWKEDPCGTIKWQVDFKTKKGNPLIYAVFGSGSNRTLFLGGVHPDELTPIPLSFRLASHLHDNLKSVIKEGIQVVIAPLVNPDGFFLKTPLRTNGFVDVNRNFLTLDWYNTSLETWKNKRGAAERYFPGYFPNTEIETLFQTFLMDAYSPNKIVSIHAPLGFYDFDGPGDPKPRFSALHAQKALHLIRTVSEKSRNYRVVYFSFYPGSLGNFAGNERHIPTITLELETTKPERVNSYWDQFLPGFIQSIEYPY